MPLVAEKPAACTVKSPHLLNIGESQFLSGCAIVDVTFPNMGVVNIQKISFQNYYCATLSIKFKKHRKAPGGDIHTEWVKALKNYQLMPNPHYETNGECFVSLTTGDFLTDTENIGAVRFILRQPSPCWNTFTIENVEIYSVPDKNLMVNSLPQWLISGEDDLHIGLMNSDGIPRDQALKEGLPDPAELSSKLHDLWTLDQVTKQSEPISDTPLGRFDIDGCYEINLLSYNN